MLEALIFRAWIWRSYIKIDPLGVDSKSNGLHMGRDGVRGIPSNRYPLANSTMTQ